ncbi:MAG: hypothetical protein UMR38_00620 [Candidatus Izemoplasma sp.]|nr:hypothetical protein [Candidatus Izemoplasma sp.]
MDKTVDRLLENALKEEVPNGDITSELLLFHSTAEITIHANSNGIVSGTQFIKRLYEIINPEIVLKVINDHGVWVDSGTIIMIIHGPACDVLKGLGIAKNFLKRLSGIATLTHHYVNLLKHTDTLLLDNRLTTPNFRVFEKAAVIDGGGINHRFTLSDYCVITKDHLKEYSTIEAAVSHVLKHLSTDVKVEVVVETIEDYIAASKTACDIIRIHNMSAQMVEKCLDYAHDKLLIATHENTDTLINDIGHSGIKFIMIPEITEDYTLFNITVQIQ